MGTVAGRHIARAITGLCFGLIASMTQAQALEDQLEKTLAAQPGRYLGYETVPLQHASAVPEKFLILDFRFPEPQSEQLLQASVHRICQAVLLDQRLINTLSAGGYNRLAVAFDRHYQYDCF